VGTDRKGVDRIRWRLERNGQSAPSSSGTATRAGTPPRSAPRHRQDDRQEVGRRRRRRAPARRWRRHEVARTIGPRLVARPDRSRSHLRRHRPAARLRTWNHEVSRSRHAAPGPPDPEASPGRLAWAKLTPGLPGPSGTPGPGNITSPDANAETLKVPDRLHPLTLRVAEPVDGRANQRSPVWLRRH